MANVVWRWSTEDVQSFITLSELIGSIPELSELESSWGLGLYVPRFPKSTPALTAPRFATIEDAWQARRKHPIYKWLDKNGSFRAALLTFKRCQRKAQNEKLKAPNAELVFWRLVVETLGFYFRSKVAITRSRRAMTRARVLAGKQVDGLLGFFKYGGQGLSCYLNQPVLEQLLRDLRGDLQSRRRQYEGARVAGSHELVYLAYTLDRELGLHSPTILRNIGNVMGLSRDDGACRRYARRAKELREEISSNRAGSEVFMSMNLNRAEIDKK